jgi:hypothetical protein
MRLLTSIIGIGLCLMLACSKVQAQGIAPAADCPPRIRMEYPPLVPCPPSYPLPQAPGTTPPAQTEPGRPSEPIAPPDALAQAAATPEAGPGDVGSFSPQMFGDLIGVSGRRVVTLAHGVTRVVRVPLASAGAFKIPENESPRPVDRVFATYNYFDGVNHSLNPGFQTNLHREVIGFEKTFLNGNASIGMRVPFVQLTGTAGVDDDQISDITVVLKYAFINDRETGNVVSGGLVVTTPTGKDFVDVDGTVFNSTIIQPWMGYIVNASRDWYIHGFLSLDVPTDSKDIVLLGNSVGTGYWLTRNQSSRFIYGIVPTVEAHLNIPLNHRGSEKIPLGVPDTLDITSGFHLILRNGWALSTAVGVPITGPKPNEIEGILQLNMRF